MKIALVCSSGRHLAQLHRLEPWWRDHDRLWVAFDTREAVVLLAGERTVWAHHPTTRNLPTALRNLLLARRVLSTGAARRCCLRRRGGRGAVLPAGEVARDRDRLHRGDRPDRDADAHGQARLSARRPVLRPVARAGRAVPARRRYRSAPVEERDGILPIQTARAGPGRHHDQRPGGSRAAAPVIVVGRGADAPGRDGAGRGHLARVTAGPGPGFRRRVPKAADRSRPATALHRSGPSPHWPFGPLRVLARLAYDTSLRAKGEEPLR